jgi:C1A family cysteine protease
MAFYRYNLKRDPQDERDFKFSSVVQPGIRVKLPKEVDIRYKLPKVYDQGPLGSCTANAGNAYRISMLEDKTKELSRLYLYYKEREMEGTIEEDTGACMRSICKVYQKNGVCEESYMPYVPMRFKDKPPVEADENAANYKVGVYRSISTIDQIKEHLAFKRLPVLAGMMIYESFEAESVARTGKMSMPKKGEKELGGHAVLIVGYIDSWIPGKGVFIVRNSWGESWGDRGHFYMPYDFVKAEHAWDFWVME